MPQEQLPVKILETGGQRSTEGRITVQFWEKKERTARAFKYGGICAFAGCVSVIFPLVHFVLVPGLLLAAPIVTLVLLGKESVILGGEGICPRCSAAYSIPRTSFRFPFNDVCTSCRGEVRVEEIPAPAD